ncbi:MAG: lytic transglycosylase domain-containing protein [Bacteroidales bacterium]|nr:lytic transglycosylase domain-containing protein [Bacteroidales bacterium]
MKKGKYFNPIYIIILIIAFIPYLMGSTHLTMDSTTQVTESTTPEVPEAVTFAGEKLVLDRYDKREKMDRELMSFSFMHTNSHLILKRANRFFPIIEPLLQKNNVPDDLKYLMVIESSMNLLARSHAGAAGLWQFMPATGREYGLEVNKNIDERYHIEKSTTAACKYLKEAYSKYGSWLAAAASYNGGKNRITTELNRQGVDEITDLWLVEETSRYVYRLIAAKLFFENPQQFGIYLKKEQLYPPLKYKEVTITKEIADLSSFAKQQGINLALLKDFNPWLREYNLENRSGRTYLLKIPTKESLFYNPKETKLHNEKWVIH